MQTFRYLLDEYRRPVLASGCGTGAVIMMSDADDAETLRELQAEYPQLVITTELYWGVRVWVARGGDGHPWLVLSSNLDRFRAALSQS
jgi:hypothetical protein